MNRLLLGLLVSVVSACGSKGGNGASGGAVINGQSAKKFYEQFYASEVQDCAGRRTTQSFIGGEVRAADGNHLDAEVHLSPEGTFRAILKIATYALSEVSGPWSVQGENIVLEGFGRGRAEMHLGRIPAIRLLHFDTATEINLTHKKSRTPGLRQCSPADNSIMKVENGKMTILSVAAEKFWSVRLFAGLARGVPIPLAGTSHQDGLNVRVHLTVLKDGRFQLRESRDGIELAKVDGVWHFEDGLVILEDWGLLAPTVRDSGKVDPEIFLERNTITKLKQPGEYRTIILDTYGS